ncbi:MAG: glycine cleavage system protein H [Anaeromyxobacter sp.]|nr:glycine cleavage system protein H [Anaeromyxobacter sp.]MBL0276682.1 glycine cleavage system protein H [Anaeromyxobacter sp.]
MTTQDFLATYDAKVMEYLLALAYLLLFVPMWKFVHGSPRTAEATAGARAAASAAAAPTAHPALGWFHVPDGIALATGHTWARADADGLVTVGIDDFAQKLVDPETVVLPTTGDHVLQGQPAFAVGDLVTTVPMLSPVDGEVVAVNAAARDQPAALRDPYGAGWLFKVKVPAAASRAHLMVGEKARAFLERAAETLSGQLNPELGYVLQDGGTPIHGIAKALAGEGWATLARRFFRAGP